MQTYNYKNYILNLIQKNEYICYLPFLVGPYGKIVVHFDWLRAWDALTAGCHFPVIDLSGLLVVRKSFFFAIAGLLSINYNCYAILFK